MPPGQFGVIERDVRSCSSRCTLNTTKVQNCKVTGIYPKMEHVFFCLHISRSVGAGLFVRPFECGGGGGGGGGSGSGLLFSVIASAKMYNFVCSMAGLVRSFNLCRHF